MSRLKQLAKKILYYTLPSSYVLMFHHITQTPQLQKSGCVLSFEHFCEIVMHYLEHIVSLEAVLHRKRGKIAITFDDGLADVYEIAYPVLKERGIPFAVFVITDFLDIPGYITTEQLVELSRDPLVTIGSHGVSHEVFPNMKTEQKKRELTDSRGILERITQRGIDVFAYSHGQVDKETLNLAKCYRYAMGVKSVPLNRFTEKRNCMPRINVEEATYEAVKKMLGKILINKRRGAKYGIM